MTEYSFGDIILVPFPTTDQTDTKKRPAAVISSAAYNHHRPDIIIMAVTSQRYSASYFGDVFIEEWQQAGLLKPSIIKPILTTVEKGLVKRRLGRLAGIDRSRLQATMQDILGE